MHESRFDRDAAHDESVHGRLPLVDAAAGDEGIDDPERPSFSEATLDIDNDGNQTESGI